MNKNNKNMKKYVEIKLIICQNISSKIYYKLLNLKISPLISNENNDFILFEGITNISDNIIITLIDYVKDKNDEEKIVLYSSTNFEKNNLDIDINLLP